MRGVCVCLFVCLSGEYASVCVCVSAYCLFMTTLHPIAYEPLSDKKGKETSSAVSRTNSSASLQKSPSGGGNLLTTRIHTHFNLTRFSSYFALCLSTFSFCCVSFFFSYFRSNIACRPSFCSHFPCFLCYISSLIIVLFSV